MRGSTSVLSMCLVALCLFSGVIAEEAGTKRGVNSADLPEIRRREPKSDEEREAARVERRERLQAHIDQMRESGEVPTEQLDRMAAGMMGDVGSPEFMERKRQELRDRMEKMGGRDEIERHRAEHGWGRGDHDLMKEVRQERDRSRASKDHGGRARDDRVRGADLPGRDRRGPLDKFEGIDPDHADFFNSMHDPEVISEGDKEEFRDMLKDPRIKAKRKDRQRARETNFQDRQKEPHSNPQIQAKIDAMRERRNEKDLKKLDKRLDRIYRMADRFKVEDVDLPSLKTKIENLKAVGTNFDGMEHDDRMNAIEDLLSKVREIEYDIMDRTEGAAEEAMLQEESHRRHGPRVPQIPGDL